MNMKFIKKISVLFGVFLFTAGLLLNSNLYAASVGQGLTEPEVGWERYNETATAIRYNGNWLAYSTSNSYYGGTHKVTSGIGDSVEFKFYGNKMRVIGVLYIGASKNIEVSIDGVKEQMSMYREGVSYQTLNFEKTGLTNSIHHVIITNKDAKEFYVDAIDINEDGRLVGQSVPINLEAMGGDSQVKLNWDLVNDAESYTVKYGTESGKYTETTTATKDAYGNFVIPGLTNGTKYYFVVNAKVNGVDSEYSNEASATPQGGGSQPDPEPTTGDRAILVVTMTTGLEKEFDLSMKEVNDFISWYESKQAGSGPASYAINKHDNNKGPFSSRKDYMLYDRILTFEVSEYSK
ncbi:fibronectin type III domain-containing protein [Paenibacillus polymyxa]|uniref:Kelch-like protein 4 n=1 Tax=Paenibacillus polymyxa TaxID=1406 RepID=A0A378Y0K0_PAEPO|nr:fibronectin type III domain-containing protein [Paenibacillus polymyxa]MBE7901042.1 fibronectin type III domain-containing protein [Paenibacillus polymyxa]MBG9765042.1 fibronectin [Paenibacillus polymyxa]MCC3261604.1 fibronectin type III domain-containing protein [Paenibacillus polymyxa]QPK55004.1 fibronectin type III domain-containing protein [Paenibacillus polymyxa]QPK60095.1 fibronectin type III domain-containing protein [Paenibacillus polymyxa]